MRRADPDRVGVDVSWLTLGRIVAVAALVWCWLRLVDFVLIGIVAVVLAVTLNPVVEGLERRRLPRWAGATTVVVSLAALIIGFAYTTSAQLGDQVRVLGGRIGTIERDMIGRLPQSWVEMLTPEHAQQSLESHLSNAGLAVAGSALRALAVFALAAILTLYLLIEGRLTYQWLIAFVPERHRLRMHRTAAECRRVVSGYVAGNVLTSIFAAVFVFVALSLLKVPAALLLALLAGVCDFIPVLGFALSAVPAIVLAMTVSATVAISVLLLYIAYHAIENYFIAPRVYGEWLRLSNLAVVVAFAIGAELAGVVGALLALPAAAAYPSIERIWLRRALGPEVIEEHKVIEQGAAIDG
jgi:predicted PurR-regulated permease PerM